jgi:effector-binding domain-containing protein
MHDINGRYLSVNKTRETEQSNHGDDVIEESADRCIYTQVHYSDDVPAMVNPLIEYAKANGYELTGEIYGRENTNYFVDGKRLGLYRIYAPIK